MLIQWLAYQLAVCAVQIPLTIDEGYTTDRALTGRFLHITDFHPDENYRAGARLNEFCHFAPEDATGEAAPVEPALELSKHKKDHKDARAGYWGPPPNTGCDASMQLVNATFDYIKRQLVDAEGGVDFVIWTGDSARHDYDTRYPRTYKQIFASNQYMVDKMQEVFGADKHSKKFVPVVPTFGNNDVHPHNIMFPGPNSKTIARYKHMWRAWIPTDQLHIFDRGGYFAMPVLRRLSVVSLNSLYFYANNKVVDGCTAKDGPGTVQLDWLEVQLKLFRLQGMKTWIIGHIPPTERQWYDGCYDRYANLMIEFRDLVIGQVFGHVNIDHFYFIKYKSSSSVHVIESPRSKYGAAKTDTVRVLDNPLEVLNDARSNFDDLPHFPPVSKGRAKVTFDMDSVVGNLAVINVAPSVVPNYFPTMRVYEYLVHETNSRESTDGTATELTKHRKKKHKKSRIPPVDHLGPGYVQQRYTPMSYSQYFLNMTTANANATADMVDYELEYDTAEWPYYMKDLTVGSWVTLGNQISGLGGLGKLPKGSARNHAVRESLAEEEDERADEIPEAVSTTKKKKNKNKKGKKEKKRNNGFWKVFINRGFVSTGSEAGYTSD